MDTPSDVIGFLATKYAYFEFIPACVGTILNIFHLIILTRKSMRHTSINILMAGISICDLLNMLYLIYLRVSNFINDDAECENYVTYPQAMITFITMGIKEITRRLSTWLGVLLASVRLIIIKSSTNPRFNHISKQAFGIQASLVFLLFSVLVSSLYFARITITEYPTRWMPLEHCKNYPSNYSEPTYGFSFGNFLFIEEDTAEQIYFIADGGFKVLAAVLLPILTIFLIVELKVAKEKISVSSLRNPTESSKSNSTTILVVLMTMTFIIADGPIGVAGIVQGIFMKKEMVEEMVTVVMILSILGIFVTFNSTIHCVICLFVSSPYRQTVKSLFLCKDENPNTIFQTSRISRSGASKARQRISN